MKRRRAREYALQMLFRSEFLAGGPDLSGFWLGKDEEPDVKEFANALVHGTIAKLQEVDRAIVRAAENWDMERMATVDRNILRAATYELLFRTDIPHAVSINEAIEIAKKYSTEESASFINGILDRIARAAGRV